MANLLTLRHLNNARFLRWFRQRGASFAMLRGVYWILATIFLVIALAVPRWRPVGVAGCVVLGLMLTWAMVQRLRGNDPGEKPIVQERGRPTSPGRQVQALPLDSVVVDGLQLSGGGAPFDLSGRVANQSHEVLLKSVTIRITRRDCYAGALDPSGCVLLWQDQHWTEVSVPPGQSRDFATSIWVRGAAPRPRGTVQDSFELVAATGEAVAKVEKEDNQ